MTLQDWKKLLKAMDKARKPVTCSYDQTDFDTVDVDTLIDELQQLTGEKVRLE